MIRPIINPASQRHIVFRCTMIYIVLYSRITMLYLRLSPSGVACFEKKSWDSMLYKRSQTFILYKFLFDKVKKNISDHFFFVASGGSGSFPATRRRSCRYEASRIPQSLAFIDNKQ